MLLFVAQLLLLCGFAAIVVAPIALVIFGYKFAFRRRARRAFLITSFFIAGAVAAGFVLWRLLPATWTLSFSDTVKAAGDAKTYGHPVEHYAEGVVVMLAAGGVLGGSLGAAVTALLTRQKLAR